MTFPDVSYYIKQKNNKLLSELAFHIPFLLIALVSILILLSVIGVIPTSGVGLDENGNPDCTPYQSPWGVVCE